MLLAYPRSKLRGMRLQSTFNSWRSCRKSGEIHNRAARFSAPLIYRWFFHTIVPLIEMSVWTLLN